MVVLRILETSLYLFFSVIADYIQVDLVSFLEILDCVLVIGLIKNLTGIYFESTTQAQEGREDNKFERVVVPVVHSVMVFKMCEGLGLPAQLAAESDWQISVTKKETSSHS
ncbi:hypothetical protein TNIN_50261 [Trichonephila inaurata madagascariensis]|uniref:Uncharacterized protein n=1 Tax=Trichonephila inaurata madagascariensis TaxID=2747483 RepID=A0A8X6XP84_9ARAC|nr:hypothetical protein TNIN_50261 [Trichonephila inaurata madagascariensis]